MLKSMRSFIDLQLDRVTESPASPRLKVPPGGHVSLTYASRTDVRDYVGGLSVAYLELLRTTNRETMNTLSSWVGQLTLDQNAVRLYSKRIFYGDDPFKALEATSVSLLYLGGVRQ